MASFLDQSTRLSSALRHRGPKWLNLGWRHVSDFRGSLLVGSSWNVLFRGVCSQPYGCFHTWGYPSNGWFTVEKLMKLDDLGLSSFQETSICHRSRCWSSMRLDWFARYSAKKWYRKWITTVWRAEVKPLLCRCCCWTLFLWSLMIVYVYQIWLPLRIESPIPMFC